MRMTTALAVLLQLSFAAGCTQDRAVPTAPDAPPSLQPSISDGAHGGNEHVFFLPPLVPEPEYTGTFDATRSPTVHICELDGSGCTATVAEFTLETGPGSETVRVDTVAEHYSVNWHTNEFDLTTGTIYRIRILVEGQKVAHADVEPVSSGKEMKNSESGDIISLKDGRTLPIKFRIEEGLDVSDRVPAVTPDGVPDAIYNPADMDKGMLLDIVLVVFTPGSSQVDRQAAVDSVSGMVVGGKRVFGDDGFYFVQIEHDGTSEPLFRAINRLNSLPQVETAAPEFVGNFNLYLTPVDGSGFEEGDWSLKTADASADNWGLERIAGPMAWGCNIGASGTNIGVVDHGFHSTPDIDGVHPLS